MRPASDAIPLGSQWVDGNGQVVTVESYRRRVVDIESVEVVDVDGTVRRWPYHEFRRRFRRALHPADTARCETQT
jgi:hypothetical protein